MDSTSILEIVKQVGVPVATLGVCLFFLGRYVLQLDKRLDDKDAAHCAERKEDRASHLDALAHIGTDLAARIDRLADRIGRGAAPLAVALLGCLACASSHALDVTSKSETVAASVAHESEAEHRTETVSAAPVRIVTRDTIQREPQPASWIAAHPWAPTTTLVLTRVRTEERGPVQTMLREASTERKVETTAEHTAAVSTREEKSQYHPAVSLHLFLAGGALVLAAVAYLGLRIYGGPLLAFLSRVKPWA